MFGDALRECVFGKVDDPAIPHVVLVGDSHALMLLPALVELTEQGKISVTAQIKRTCAWTRDPIKSPDQSKVDSCQEWKSKLEPWLLAQAPKADLLVTTGYTLYNSGSHAAQVESMQAAWKPLAELGVPIVALRDAPHHSEDPVDCLANVEKVTPSSCALKKRDALGYFDAFAETAGTVKGSKLLDLTDFYCRDGACPAVIGGVAVYRDVHHLTVTYSKTLAPYLYRGLVGLGALPGTK